MDLNKEQSPTTTASTTTTDSIDFELDIEDSSGVAPNNNNSSKSNVVKRVKVEETLQQERLQNEETREALVKIDTKVSHGFKSFIDGRLRLLLVCIFS